MAIELQPYGTSDYETLSRMVADSYQPPQRLIDRVAEAGGTIRGARAEEFGTYSPASNAHRRSGGYTRPEYQTVLHNTIPFCPLYIGRLEDPDPGYYVARMTRELGTTTLHHVEGNTVSFAVRDPGGHTYVSFSVRVVPTLDVGRFYSLWQPAYGGLLRLIAPAVERFGLFLSNDGISVREERSFQGEVSSRDLDITNQRWVYKFLTGSESPYTSYCGYGFEHLFSYALGLPIFTADYLQIDTATNRYVGDPARLEDPLYRAFISYILNCANNHTGRIAIGRRTDADIRRKMSEVLGKANATSSPTMLAAMLDIDLSHKVVGKKLEGIPGDVRDGIAGQKVLEILGSKRESIMKRFGVNPLENNSLAS